MSVGPKFISPPTVQLVGEWEHADFAVAIERIQSDAHVVTDSGEAELIVLSQCRPGEISDREVQSLRRAAPLAGFVGLLGSWCEGETRTGRPWPDVSRLYWYEFPAWWHVQLRLRAAGLCPEWARPGNSAVRTQTRGPKSRIHSPKQLLILRTFCRDSAAALSDVLEQAGAATAWHGSPQTDFSLRWASAGIWDGGQLNDHEAADLTTFCRTLARDAAPVIALLDFPRRDSYDRAIACGAATVMGKPWRNEELMATVQMLTSDVTAARAA